jgi:hypothetical protein
MKNKKHAMKNTKRVEATGFRFFHFSFFIACFSFVLAPLSDRLTAEP